MKDFQISAVHQPHSPIPARADQTEIDSRPLKSLTPGLTPQPFSERQLNAFRSTWGSSKEADPAVPQRVAAAKQHQNDGPQSSRSTDKHSNASSRGFGIKQHDEEAQSRCRLTTTAELEQRLVQAGPLSTPLCMFVRYRRLAQSSCVHFAPGRHSETPLHAYASTGWSMLPVCSKLGSGVACCQQCPCTNVVGRPVSIAYGVKMYPACTAPLQDTTRGCRQALADGQHWLPP